MDLGVFYELAWMSGFGEQASLPVPGINRFAKVAGDRLTDGVVVYGGDKRQLKSDWEVWPVTEFDCFGSRAYPLFAD